MDKDKVLEIARECGLGYLVDSEDEFFAGESVEQFASAIEAAVREECAKDAERYQWLKGQGKTMAVDNAQGKFRVVDMSVNLVVTEWEDSFDDAIDEAIRNMGKEE